MIAGSEKSQMPKSRPPLVDQHLQYSPQFQDATAPEDPSDLDVIANTYRWVIDDTAFEDLIAGWENKLDATDTEKSPTRVSSRLFNHLVTFRDTLENLASPHSADPMKIAVSDVPGPAMVTSPDGRVVTINVAGERAFGVRQGAKMDIDLISPQSRDDYAALLRSATSGGNAAHAILTLDLATGGQEQSMLAEAYLTSGANWLSIELLLQQDHPLCIHHLAYDGLSHCG